MPTTVNNLKVFVASPSDVVDERETLKQVIDELNKMLGARSNLRLELVQWQTDSYPSIGKDPQSVINEQIGDDYDIFVGILWKRFGTPTGRAESGTAEEFERAYQRAREKPNSIKVMFYFNESPVSLTELEAIEQYKKVISFRKSIREQGVYDWSYKKPEDFTSLVRLHLGRVMEEFGTKWGQSSEEKTAVKVEFEPEGNAVTSIQPDQQDLDTEDGYLDLIIQSVEDFKLGTESINRIGSLLTDLNEKTEAGTAEITQLSKPINPNEARLIINRQADNWESFAKRAEAELPILSAKFRSGIDSYIKAAQIMDDFETKDREIVKDGLDAILNLKGSAIDAQKSTQGFRTVVQGLPRMTVRLNHAKRYLVEVLDKIIEEYRAAENLSTEAEKVFVDLLEKIDSGEADAHANDGQ